MARPYSSNGSSLAQRLATQWQQQTGRSASASDPEFVAWSPGAMTALQSSDKEALERHQRNWNRVRNVAYVAAAVPFGAAALSALPAAASAGAAPTVQTGATMAGRIPWWNVASKGVDTLFGIASNRQQGRANNRAFDYQRQQDERAYQMDMERERVRREEYLAQQAQLKAQWDATQKFEAEKWAAMEEERLHRRALEDAKEARQAPYRAASLAALQELPGLWASGGTSPGLGSLGSYRRG